jgi:hypothetical protein
MTNNERLSDNLSNLIMLPTPSGFEARRAEASGIEDPFVKVSVWDNVNSGGPRTDFRVGGVQRYDNYAAYGENSTVGVGQDVRIEVSTELIDDQRAKAGYAERLAELAFDMSAEGKDHPRC